MGCQDIKDIFAAYKSKRGMRYMDFLNGVRVSAPRMPCPLVAGFPAIGLSLPVLPPLTHRVR